MSSSIEGLVVEAISEISRDGSDVYPKDIAAWLNGHEPSLPQISDRALSSILDRLNIVRIHKKAGNKLILSPEDLVQLQDYYGQTDLPVAS